MSEEQGEQKAGKQDAAKIIALDNGVVRFFTEYDTLVSGNNALALSALPKREPIVVSLEDNVIDLTSRKQEMTDNIHAAARQLKTHYDRVANDDARFIPHWQQDVSFTDAVKVFPAPTRRYLFESYKHFLERNGLQERLTLDARLEYFRSFYNQASKDNYSMMPENRKKTIKAFKRHRNPIYVNIASGIQGLAGASILVGGYVTATSENPAIHDLFEIAIITCPVTLAFILGGIMMYDELSKMKLGFENVVHKPMLEKAKYADQLIPMIHKYAA